MNVKQWEETPLLSASKRACMESVRRQYVEKLTREFVESCSFSEDVQNEPFIAEEKQAMVSKFPDNVTQICEWTYKREAGDLVVHARTAVEALRFIAAHGFTNLNPKNLSQTSGKAL